MNLSDCIGEATEYDKKESLEERRPKSWLKSVSAFANGVGGSLVFGISDDGTLVGLADAHGDSEKISEQIKARLDPVPQTVLDIHAELGMEFIVLKVPAGQETPYYYVGDGSRVAYVRIGNESVPASAADLKRLVLRGSNMTFDSLPTPYKKSDWSFARLKSAYRMCTGGEMDDSDFVSFGLADEGGMLTNADALLTDEPAVRHSRLFCTRWYGLDKASGVIDALDSKEYSGSLITLLDNGEEFILNNTKKPWKKTGSGRIEMPEYPEAAVHECLVNALIHRDYTELGSEVHIDIFDNRMTIYSPGGMPDGSLVQDLDTDDVASKRRNPVIADLFSRMHYMERRGSGFKKINAAYRNAANYSEGLAPKFSSTPSSFFVTLYNLNYQASDEQEVPVSKKTGVSSEKQAFESKKTGVSSEKQVLESEKTVVSSEKQAFEPEKTGVSSETLKFSLRKQAFKDYLDSLKLSCPTAEKILVLYDAFGTETPFARADIMNVTGITSSPSGDLLRKMKDMGLIEPVSGQGKGKYRFVPK